MFSCFVPFRAAVLAPGATADFFTFAGGGANRPGEKHKNNISSASVWVWVCVWRLVVVLWVCVLCSAF